MGKKGGFWGGVKKVLGGIAPVLGTAIGGPFGGIAGTLLSKTLGVDAEPEAIEKALVNASPEQIAAIKKVELDHKAELVRIAAEREANELAADTARINAVNETMRAEATQSKYWYSAAWRPFWGFASGSAFFAVCVFICYLGYQAIVKGEPQAMTMIPQLISPFAMLFAIPGAILGVSAWHRGKMQREQQAKTPQNILTSILSGGEDS